MTGLTLLALFLAFCWGCAWAMFLQRTRLGQWLAHKRTYMTVVAGVGVDLLIALLVIPLEVWIDIVVIIAASSVGIIARSISNELEEHRELERINVHTDEAADQRDQ